MAVEQKIKQLQDIDFFKGLGESHLPELAAMCREVEFSARTTIFEEYEPAKEVYFLLEGRVSLAICDAGNCSQLALLGKGDMLGWSPIVGRTRLFDTARTTTVVKALAFDADDLLEFCRRNTDFGFEFMRRAATVLSERLIGARRQLLEASGLHLQDYAIESD